MNTQSPLFAALAVLLMGGALSAQRNDARDLRIATEIRSVINRYDRYTVFDDVTASVKEGLVTLTGKVTLAAKSSEIERQVKRVDGVTIVQNQIQALPASQFDDQIRKDVYHAIYRHQNFLEYGLLEKPPIHIIVDRGHVTLTGFVHSEVDRKLAQSLAMQADAQSVTNKLVVRSRSRSPFG
jgi:hyperosmotically inducible protein